MTREESAGERGYLPDARGIGRRMRISSGRMGNRQESGDISRTRAESAGE
ncbi:hypothetical protein ACFOGI_13310 [Virgibacillus xinjiangensis]|uniref:Uncharacterized protein n=1 Tax=Virgibacillus xinjiangensis TaxID=393090 RepID=A0ABV7CXV4_9BACI